MTGEWRANKLKSYPNVKRTEKKQMKPNELIVHIIITLGVNNCL